MPVAVFERARITQRVQAAVKYAASFKGMRRDLAAWFDTVGLDSVLGLASCDELFSARAREMLHTTSAVRYPTFRRAGGRWQNWNGYGVSALEHRVLKAMIRRALGPELRALSNAVIIPLGKATEAVEYLCQSGQLDASRCVLGFPHPSAASARRHELFAARQGNLERQVAAIRPLGDTSQVAAACTAAPAPEPHAPGRAGDEIRIELTDGNIRNGHFYLRRHLNLFPSDAAGPQTGPTAPGRCSESTSPAIWMPSPRTSPEGTS